MRPMDDWTKASMPLWKQKVRSLRRNQEAESVTDLSGGALNALDRMTAWEQGNEPAKVARIRERLGKMGVDLDKFGDQGSAESAIQRMAMSGNPAMARWGARLSAYGNIEDGRRPAELRAQGEIAEGWTGAQDLFRSFLSQPYDPNSGAALAVAANYTAGRKQSLFDSLNRIDANIADAKTNIDMGTLSSIGDTLATMDALKEQERLSRIQMGISGVGAIGSVVGGIGSLGASAAGPAARTSALDAPVDPWADPWGDVPYENQVRL